MNKEILRIRTERNLGNEMDSKAKKIDDEHLDALIAKLNSNLSDLFYIRDVKDVDIEVYVDKLIENIYTILDTFIDMNVYPGYFYDQVVAINCEYQNKMKKIAKLKNDYRARKQIELVVDIKLEKAMLQGIDKDYHHFEAYDNKDIGDAYNALTKIFGRFEIPFGTKTKEKCLKAFDVFYYRHNSLVVSLMNTDFDYQDIGSLSMLLFEYLSFFVSIGINPKEYLDKYIDKHANDKDRIGKK